MKNVKIGDVEVLSFRLDEGWTKRDLYDRLMDMAGSTEGFNPNQYSEYYLKIFGYYDTNIVPEDLSCHACPKNHFYRKYDDYNGLRSKKQPVLVLRSEFNDFREYEIMCSYYTDAPDENDKRNNIILCADNNSIGNWLKKKFGIKP